MEDVSRRSGISSSSYYFFVLHWITQSYKLRTRPVIVGNTESASRLAPREGYASRYYSIHAMLTWHICTIEASRLNESSLQQIWTTTLARDCQENTWRASLSMFLQTLSNSHSPSYFVRPWQNFLIWILLPSPQHLVTSFFESF